MYETFNYATQNTMTFFAKISFCCITYYLAIVDATEILTCHELEAKAKGSLDKLRLHGDNQTLPHLCVLYIQAQPLKTLQIANYSITPIQVNRLLRTQPSLRKGEFINAQITTFDLECLNTTPRLEELTLNNNSPLHFVGTTTTKLQTLNLNGCDLHGLNMTNLTQALSELKYLNVMDNPHLNISTFRADEFPKLRLINNMTISDFLEVSTSVNVQPIYISTLPETTCFIAVALICSIGLLIAFIYYIKRNKNKKTTDQELQPIEQYPGTAHEVHE